LALESHKERPAVSVVIPNWNGRRWLEGCLASVAEQTLAPDEVVVVDNGSTDGSLEYLRCDHPRVRVVELAYNSGFARAANLGLDAASGELVALLNNDVRLSPTWLETIVGAFWREPRVACVACKILELGDPSIVYDAGDILRRDGVCEQRGRFCADDGRWDQPGEVFGACAAAAVYRREAVLQTGGFDERYFAYLEDVELALRLRLAGWRCLYVPAVAWHAGEGSSHRLRGGHHRLVARNTLLLVAKAFPLRWLPLVLYRQLGWGWHAVRERRLRSHLSGLLAALPLLPSMLRERRRAAGSATLPISVVIPPRSFRGRRAADHPAGRSSRATAR